MVDRRFHELYPVTAYLLLLNFAFFALEVIQHLKLAREIPDLLSVGGIAVPVTDILGSLSLPKVRQGEWWRVVSAGFLHAGFLHILMNGFVLYDLGRLCEPLLSSWKLLVVYGASLAGGSAGSLLYKAWRGGREADIPSVGASGALCGLIGLLLVYAVRERHHELRDGILRWIAWIVVLTLLVPSVDHAAHAGGFAVGCAAGLTVRDYMPSRAAARWRYPGYAVAAAGLACLGWALWSYFTRR
ncbi:MAG: rhomboid family intramembrane serine protease [Planctomycetes bacterium]|nr:rhomboid family intramembrane serine protease [Planctomycetota bacterium]